MRFNAITPADAGRYYCSATNIYGNTTKVAEVVVNRGASVEQIPNARRYEINEGEDVTLSCDIKRSREPIRSDLRVRQNVINNLTSFQVVSSFCGLNIILLSLYRYKLLAFVCCS